MGQSYHPVFGAPECHNLPTAGAIARRARPVDLVHLARQTGGDKALEEEVLHLFLRQANLLARDLNGKTSTEARRRLAHTLNGSARAVGAFEVANIAERIENSPEKSKDIRSLVASVDEACDYISSLLR